MAATTKTFARDGHLLSAEVTGHPPRLLALHGQIGVAAVVRAAIESFSPAMLAPDIRGRGKSVCRHADHHSWDAYVDDVVWMLDEVDVERVVVVGSSLGAGLALRLAMRHPQRVSGLLLWASPYAGAERGWLPSQRQRQEPVLAMASHVLDAGIDAAVSRRVQSDPTIDAEALAARWKLTTPRASPPRSSPSAGSNRS